MFGRRSNLQDEYDTLHAPMEGDAKSKHQHRSSLRYPFKGLEIPTKPGYSLAPSRLCDKIHEHVSVDKDIFTQRRTVKYDDKKVEREQKYRPEIAVKFLPDSTIILDPPDTSSTGVELDQPEIELNS